ncbi:hypothetical protein RJ639_004055 [Escallonia herrerae]|uniref:Zinc finger, CCHC-type n=1 Tax=Escallonia herrerae TaxID=1293975 RepID=A0AA88W104_9ASTE|nr:hypothetical protein RJ639_004055 [Escallonia herrerae]
MHFLLVTVKVYYVIVNPRPPEPGENEEESVAKTRERLRWDQDDEICRGHILNGMSNMLFDAYHTVKTAKELWNQLERCYITEDATSKRFIVSKFFDYKMVDGRSVMEQFNVIKSILDRYSQHKLALDEFIVVTSIIDKLPPSWKNFKNSLKHRKEDINLDELGTHLRIEEDLRKEEKSKSEGIKRLLVAGSNGNAVFYSVGMAENGGNAAEVKRLDRHGGNAGLVVDGGGEKKGFLGTVVGMAGIDGIVVGMVGSEVAGKGGSVTFGTDGIVGKVGFGKDGIWVLGSGGSEDFGKVVGAVGSVGKGDVGIGGNAAFGSVGMAGSGGNVAFGKGGIVGSAGAACGEVNSDSKYTLSTLSFSSSNHAETLQSFGAVGLGESPLCIQCKQ